MPWLHDRDVAVFLDDCSERTPAEPGAWPPLPLHQVGIVAMGLCLIDSVLTTPLLEACRHFGRYEFLLTCTVPKAPGATALSVNPVRLF